MDSLTRPARSLVVGAPKNQALAAAGPTNWSASGTSWKGAPLPSHAAVAWMIVQPAGTVSEYPYVLEVNAVGPAEELAATVGTGVAAVALALADGIDDGVGIDEAATEATAIGDDAGVEAGPLVQAATTIASEE